MEKISKKWKRHNNGDYQWGLYKISVKVVRHPQGQFNTYWAYAPGGGCLYAAGDDLVLAKKRCYEHFENKPTELP